MGCRHFYEWEDCPQCSPKPAPIRRSSTRPIHCYVCHAHGVYRYFKDFHAHPDGWFIRQRWLGGSHVTQYVCSIACAERCEEPEL